MSMEFDFKTFWKVTLSTSILVYLCASFIKWDIAWIKEIDKYSIPERISVLFLYVSKVAFDVLISMGDWAKKTFNP